MDTVSTGCFGPEARRDCRMSDYGKGVLYQNNLGSDSMCVCLRTPEIFGGAEDAGRWTLAVRSDGTRATGRPHYRIVLAPSSARS